MSLNNIKRKKDLNYLIFEGNSNTFGAASSVPVITINSDNEVTISNTAISIPTSSVVGIDELAIVYAIVL